MTRKLQETIIELMIFQEGKKYCKNYNRTLFINEVLDHLKKINGYTIFETVNQKSNGTIEVEEIKFHFLVLKIKNLISILYEDVHTESKLFLTDLIVRCLKVLKEDILLHERIDQINSIKIEFVMLPSRHIQLSNVQFIENTINNTKSKRKSPFDYNFLKNNHPIQLPNVLNFLRNKSQYSSKTIEQIIDNKICKYRNHGSTEILNHCFFQSKKKIYSLVGCISFHEFLHLNLMELGGYFHPLQPKMKISKPFLNPREQITLLLLILNSGVISKIYNTLFISDTSPSEFYERIIYPTIRKIPFEIIEFNDEYSSNEIYMVPSEIPEITNDEFIQKINLEP